MCRSAEHLYITVLPCAVLERVVITKEVEEEKNCDKDDCVSGENKTTCSPLDLPTSHTYSVAVKY